MIPEMLRRAWGNMRRTSSAVLWLKVQVLGLYIWKKSFRPCSQFVCFKDGLRKASSQWSSGRPGQEPCWGPSSASHDWYQPLKNNPHIPLSISVHRSSYGVHSSSISLLLRVRCLYPMLSLVSLCASNRQKIRYLNHFFPPRKSGEEWLGCRKECQKFRFESVACAALLPWLFRTLSSLMPLLL